MRHNAKATTRHTSIRPSHPGEAVADGLNEAGVSKVAFATALGISRNTVYVLRDGRTGVTAQMALRLEAVIGSTAGTWLTLQSAHDLWAARASIGVSKLDRIAAA